MRSADNFLRGRSCSGGAPRPIPGPQPELSARNPTQESYRKHRNCRGPQGLVGMQRIEAPRNAGIRETHRNARPQELQVCADRRKLGDPKDRRNSSDRRNQGPTWTAKTAETEQPEPQKPPESRAPATAGPAGRNAKTLRPRIFAGAGGVRLFNAPAGTFRQSIRSIAVALRHRDSGPQGSASSYFAARSSPSSRPSRPPGRRNRADPYRRGSGDRRSRSPSGSPADRPCLDGGLVESTSCSLLERCGRM